MVDDTVRQSIGETLASWDRTAAAIRARDAEQLRSEFVERFPIDAWSTMPLTDYALGQDTQDTVSYWLEYKTGLIGSITAPMRPSASQVSGKAGILGSITPT